MNLGAELTVLGAVVAGELGLLRRGSSLGRRERGAPGGHTGR
jgi:hypothetical protein